jgi:23S rRNA (guanosine2251-2'-O)-methyltransferase
MILYGRNPVEEALKARRRPVKQVWATRGAMKEPWLANLKGVRVQAAQGDEIAQRAGTEAHQGVCAEVGPYPYADPNALLRASGPSLIVVLDQITDPQNLGAICRTAEVAGAAGVVIPDRRSAEVTPAACKASAGAVEWLPVARVTNVADYLAAAKAADFWVYGAAGDGATPFREPDYGDRAVLVMGAEGRGLRPRVADACDVLISLPQRGRLDSLNVSAAAAVLVYEILHVPG